jgi:hypothetical protein
MNRWHWGVLLGLLPLFAGCGSTGPGNSVPLDRVAPDRFETATFAMG